MSDTLKIDLPSRRDQGGWQATRSEQLPVRACVHRLPAPTRLYFLREAHPWHTYISGFASHSLQRSFSFIQLRRTHSRT
jgi:hypothetical protein